MIAIMIVAIITPLRINILHYYRLIASDPRRLVAFFTSNDAIGTIILPRHYDQRIGETREFGISIFDVFEFRYAISPYK